MGRKCYAKVHILRDIAYKCVSIGRLCVLVMRNFFANKDIHIHKLLWQCGELNLELEEWEIKRNWKWQIKPFLLVTAVFHFWNFLIQWISYLKERWLDANPTVLAAFLITQLVKKRSMLIVKCLQWVVDRNHLPFHSASLSLQVPAVQHCLEY